MLYNPNFEDIKRRMTAFWEHEALERCCVSFETQRPDKAAVKKEKYYYDVEKADTINREYFASMASFGENLNCIFPYFGTAGIAEYTGCKVTYTPKTAWFDPWMTDEPDAGDCGLLLAPFGGAGYIKTHPHTIVIAPDRPSGESAIWVNSVQVSLPSSLEIAYSSVYDVLEFTGAFYELAGVRSLARISPDYGCCGTRLISAEQLSEMFLC